MSCGLLLASAFLGVLPSAAVQDYRIGERGEVLRIEGAVRTELRVLAEREPGRVADWTPHAAGTAFFVAENGLFLAGPDSDVLDRIDLQPLDRSLAPAASVAVFAPLPGTPLAVARADERRLWVLTTESLCAVDTRQLLWSAVGLGAPLPGRGLGWSFAADGEIVLETSGGPVRVAPERRPPPVVRVVSVQGRAHTPGAAHEIAYGERIELQLELSEGAHAMWRHAERFKWIALDPRAPSLEPQRPGRQSLRVVAFDSALRRSEPVRVELVVGYPRALDKRVLATVAAAVGLLSFGSVIFATLRRGGGLRVLLQDLLLTALSLGLVLQVVAALFPHSKGWPFVGFSMYTQPSSKHRVVTRLEFLGERADGSRVALQPPGGAYGKYETERALQRFLHDEDGAVERFLEQWNRSRPAAPLRRLLVMCKRRRLCPEGPVDVPALCFLDEPAERAP